MSNKNIVNMRNSEMRATLLSLNIEFYNDVLS